MGTAIEGNQYLNTTINDLRTHHSARSQNKNRRLWICLRDLPDVRRNISLLITSSVIGMQFLRKWKI